jgi:N6-L-threonylcarbamoyladenine synthase
MMMMPLTPTLKLSTKTTKISKLILNILGIESSCDDTAASVLTEAGVLSNVIASQSIHIQFGGVVPELASRAHHQTISQTVEQALTEAQLSIQEMDVIAVTQGPGLMGSLLVGLSFAKGLSLAHQIPIVGVNHMDAHIFANTIEHTLDYPLIALTVSGGHTQLTKLNSSNELEIIGQTRDDAAGEAFDKIGKLLGLDYPAGPKMDLHSREGNSSFHAFPKGLIHQGLDFSFSGLKTSVLYYLQDQDDAFISDHFNDICASVSHAITEVLVAKLERAMQVYSIPRAVLAGGVSANSMLREKVAIMAEENGFIIHQPAVAYCTDNAAMIAATAKVMLENEASMDLEQRLRQGWGIHPYASQSG